MNNHKNNFNVEGWQPFKINDLFTVYTGGDKPKKNDPNHKDGVLVNSIENLTKNNGINGKVLYNGDKKFLNFLSAVGRGVNTGQTFYHSELGAVFYRVLALVPKEKTKLNPYTGLFIATVLGLQKIKYSYGRVLDSGRLSNTIIRLPIDKNGDPDWDFMENYIHNLEYKNSIKLSIPEKPLLELKVKLSDRKWKYFTYEQLFIVRKGQRLTNAQLKDGSTPFLRAISSNNGISRYVDVEPNHVENTITVNYDGSIGETFYQPTKYFAIDSVNVLYPRFELNVYIAMFLITLIKLEKYRYNYGRKWHKERMEKSIIKLPVNQDNEPDWKFMENYIKSLSYSSNLQN